MYYKQLYVCKTYFNVLARHSGTYKMIYPKFKQFFCINEKYNRYPNIRLTDLYQIFDTRSYLDEYYQGKEDIENYKQAVNDLYDAVHDDLNHVNQLDKNEKKIIDNQV